MADDSMAQGALLLEHTPQTPLHMPLQYSGKLTCALAHILRFVLK